jgi:SAM-dependent methyltransferase
VLEVGCGKGGLSERIMRKLGCDVVAVDQSAHMVELTRARGVTARVADAQELPFGDGEFDCAVAAWMLYHVPSVDRALSELSRVLRPGRRLVAVTNARDSLRELGDLLGFQRAETSFSAENGGEQLRNHFDAVECRKAYGSIVFPSRAEAQDYIDHSISWGGRQLPEFEGPLRVRRAPVIFVAENAR